MVASPPTSNPTTCPGFLVVGAVSPPSSYGEVPTPEPQDMTGFGDGAFNNVIK